VALFLPVSVTLPSLLIGPENHSSSVEPLQMYTITWPL